MNDLNYSEHINIFFSCEVKKKRDVQQFIPAHVFSYLVAGTVELYADGENHLFKTGDAGLFRKNQLCKLTKYPPEGGGLFKSINIVLDQETLHNFSLEYPVKAEKSHAWKNIYLLKPDAMIDNFFNSLVPYFDPENKLDTALSNLKVKEAILLLLRYNKDLNDLLFDFKQRGKIDLEEFMQKNYMFHVPIEKLAELTGRSHASFKRDFTRIFNQPPGKWLQERRLTEAYYLLKEKNRKPSDIYLEVGFADFSHFSFAFKKQFGVAPSLV
jgi:AraC-like DNA-binding protein